MAVKYSLVSFYGLGNFIANKWEDYSIILGRDGDFHELGHLPLFGLLTMVPWNCHDASGCVI